MGRQKESKPEGISELWSKSLKAGVLTVPLGIVLTRTDNRWVILIMTPGLNQD